MSRGAIDRTRRQVLLATGALLAVPAWSAASEHGFTTRAREIEAKVGGRLGVYILDTGSGREFGWRADERFMVLSSFKALAGAWVLARAERGQGALDQRIAFPKSTLVDWSPVTEKHAGGPGMTLAELCAATITTSDNTAANLILDATGGPAALTAFLREQGDAVTRLDRREPELNRADGLKDTSTPRAMAHSLQRLALGQGLGPDSRRQLQAWLVANTTGDKRIRAGLPAGWKVGDKTGTNRSDANDIAIVWPPGRAPLVVAAYLAGSPASAADKDAALAAVGRLAADFAQAR